MTEEARLRKLEDAFLNVTRLVQSIDERMDQHLSWINQPGEAQANSDAKIAALADSHIRLSDSHIRLEEILAKLTDSHVRLSDSHVKLEEAQAKSEASIAALAEAQAHTDRRLDALIDIVRAWHEGKS